MTHAAAVHHTSTGLDSRKMAFWAFIGSECLLFGSLISTYPIYNGKSVGGPDPPDVLTLWVRALQGKLGPAQALTVEISGLYWHFVDVVWIVIFTLVYLIQ